MIADSLMVSNMIEPQVNARSAAVQGKYAEACLDEPSKRPNANRRPDQTTRAMGPSYRNPARQIVERQRLGSESDQSLSRRNQNRAGNISSGLETHPQGIEKQEKGIWPFNFSWEDIWDNACVANPNSPFGWFKPSTNEVVDHMVDDDESNIDNSKNRGVLPEAFSIPDAKASFTTASSPSFDSRFQKSVTALQIGSSEALSDQKVLSSDVNEVMQAKTQIPEGLPICPTVGRTEQPLGNIMSARGDQERKVDGDQLLRDKYNRRRVTFDLNQEKFLHPSVLVTYEVPVALNAITNGEPDSSDSQNKSLSKKRLETQSTMYDQTKRFFVPKDLTWEQALSIAEEVGRVMRVAAQQRQPEYLEGIDKTREIMEECASWYVLPRARLGPGSNSNSIDYRMLEQPRLADGVEPPEAWSLNPPDFIPDAGYEELTPDDNWRLKRIGTPKFLSQWDAYTESPAIYPLLDTRRMMSLVTTKPPGYICESMRFPTRVSNPQAYEQPEFEAFWDITSEDLSCLQREGYARMLEWLDQVPARCQIVDIFHVAFFDGSAVPDGGLSMMIMNEKHLPTPRDMCHEKTNLHWHETSESLSYNMRLHWRKTRENKAAIKAIQQARKLGLPSPITMPVLESPQVMQENRPCVVYLRPAELDDASGILSIFNWYAARSPLSSDANPTSVEGIRAIIQTIRTQNLPMIVVADPRPEPVVGKDWLVAPEKERIMGFAYVTLLSASDADVFTGDLYIFVRPEEKRNGYGEALVDQILAAVDRNYIRQTTMLFRPKPSHVPDPNPRTLTAITCRITYPASSIGKYTWIAGWMKNNFGFKEWGVLEGSRVKFGHLLDVHCIGRSIQLPEDWTVSFEFQDDV